MSDLVFGEGGWVRVLGGMTEFRVLDADDPTTTIYLKGDIDRAHVQDALRSDAFADVYGRFIVLVHDRITNSLTIYNDRYGHLSLFVARPAREVCLATRIAPLLERGIVPRRLNRSALADSLAFSIPFGRQSLVEGIESYPAGTKTTICLDSRDVRETRQWDPAVVLREPERPLSETMEGLFEAFLEGFDRSVAGEKAAVTLSGGIDSRCLLAAAHYRGAAVSSFNCSLPGSRSGNYAEKMAEMASSPYQSFPVGLEFARGYADRLRGVIDLTEGQSFSSEVECHWLREHVSSATVVLHGAFAELSKLTAMHLYFVNDAVSKSSRSALKGLLWNRFRGPLDDNVSAFSGEVRDEVRRRAEVNLESRLDAIDPALTPEHVLQVLYIEEYLSKVTKCSSLVWNDHIKTRFPFSYPRYIDLLLRTGGRDRLHQRFQMNMLKRTWPHLFDFPDANTGLRVDAPAVMKTSMLFLDRVRRGLAVGREDTRDHSDRRSWIVNMATTPESVLLDGAAGDLLDRTATEKHLAVLREPNRSSRNPVVVLRQRLAQRVSAAAIEKALMLQFWLDHTGVKP